MAFPNEVIELDVIINAQVANQQLLKMLGNVDKISAAIYRLSATSGASFKQVGNHIKELYNTQRDIEKELGNISSKAATYSKRAFGKEVDAAIKQLNDQIKLEDANAKKAAVSLLNMSEAERKLADNASKAATVLGKTFTPQEFAPVLKQFQALNKLDFSNVSKYGQNVQTLMNSIRSLSQQTGASIQDVGRYIQQNFQNVPRVALQDAVKNLNKELKGTESSANSASQSMKRFGTSVNVVRLAIGALVAVGLFQFLNAIGGAVRKTIDSIKQLELSIFKLASAERVLSKSGIEISLEDFRDIIQQITDLFPYVSNIDAKRVVAQIALLTKELGLTKKEITDIVTAIPVLASNAGITIEQATQQVINGLTTSGRGWKDLGISVDAAIIKQEAVNQKLVASEKAFDKLDATQKQHVEVLALISLLNKGVEDQLQNQADYLKTFDAATRETNAAWEDFLATLGRLLSPALTEGLQLIIDNLERMNDWLIRNEENITKVVAAFAGLIAAQKAINESTQDETWFDKTLKVVSPALAEMRKLGRVGASGFFEAFQKGYDEAIERAKNFDKAIETNTEKTKAFEDAILSLEDLEGFDKLAKDLENLQRKIEETQADFEIEQVRKLEDYQIDVNRIVEDFALKRRRVQEDSNQKIADSNKKYRDKELDDEARFQEQMRQLREKFLFNLEDALRERDARQVLRLQRQYEMDKTALQNEHDLRKKEADKQHQDDIARLKRERDDRLAELAEEEKIRLQREKEDFELRQKRDQEDHAREMEQLKQQISDRLMEFARAIGEEYDLNEGAVDALYRLLDKYYGPGGYFEGLYDYSYKSMVSRAQAMLSQVNAIVAQSQAVIGSMATAAYTGANYLQPSFLKRALNTKSPSYKFKFLGGQADGGTYFANSPTAAIFGEAGPEIASFVPLRKLGGSPVGSGLSAMGANGKVDIELWLSPDLEARIMSNTLNETANVFTRVTRNKN